MSEPSPDLRLDTTIWPILVDLSGCLCSELRAAGLPELCFCGIAPGVQPPFDVVEDDQGMAWVRTANIFPSTTFPQIASGATSCSAPLAVALEIGSVFCYPESKSEDPITSTAAWNAAQMQHAAMAAMYRAVMCCNSRGTLSIGQYQPLGPDGGLVGGTWQVWATDWRR